MSWLSPTTGRMLDHDTPHSLSDGRSERWPVVDGIPYLRTESERLVAVALAELDAGNPDAALMVLLADQDPWWSGPATDLDELRELVARRETATLREAMALLRYGPVADYFAYRWSDPTYLAGLSLLEAHWTAPDTAFELAGGIGHYARDLTRRGVRCTSADIVFSKCWLAKNWVSAETDYVVFDAKDDWPIDGRRFDLVHCQDAFYFLPDQQHVATRLRDAVADGGVLAVGHLHNENVEGGPFGPAKPAAGWRTLFPNARVYDERDLRTALLNAETPSATEWLDDPAIEAWSIVETDAKPCAISGGLALPQRDAVPTPNPLIRNGIPNWPSDRYEAEYGPAATWTDPDSAIAPERDRRLVDLPGRW